MKFGNYEINEDVLYSKNHMWVRRLDGNLFGVGITDYARKALNNIIHIEILPKGTDVKAGDVIGEVEASKAVIDITSPLNGRISGVNEKLIANPSLINQDPYCWILEMTVKDADDEVRGLMSPQQYYDALQKYTIDIYAAGYIPKSSLKYVERKLRKGGKR